MGRAEPSHCHTNRCEDSQPGQKLCSRSISILKAPATVQRGLPAAVATEGQGLTTTGDERFPGHEPLCSRPADGWISSRNPDEVLQHAGTGLEAPRSQLV